MRECAICKKSYNIKTVRSMLRSRYNPTTIKKQKANLKVVRNLIPGKKRAYVCVKCLKTITKKNLNISSLVSQK
jgi:ribosomal protein L28